MKTQITYKQLIDFFDCATKFIEKNKTADTKFINSLKSVLKQLSKNGVFDDYNEKLSLHQLSCCSVDPKTQNILKENIAGENGITSLFVYTADNQKKLNQLTKELKKETVEIHVRILPENSKVELSYIEEEAFEGIVIPKNEQDEKDLD